MGRLRMLTLVATGALALTACGASDGGSNPTTTAVPAAAAAPTNTVRLATATGIGQILVDSIGRTLYTPDEEKAGTVACVDSCSVVWVPLKPGAATPTGAAGVPALAVIDRPDGGKQVAVGGLPLYTFASEVPGTVTGQNVADAFGSLQFTWHVVMSDGTISVLPAPISRTSPYGEGGY